MVAFTVGVASIFVLVVAGAPRWSRLIVFLPIWIGGLGLMQAREKICIALAARGVCNMDAGEEKLADEAFAEQVRLKARHINRRALLTAALITVLSLVFP